MDNQTQSFLELSAMNDLVQLAADTRAAWLWSADGAKILWSNAAGAAFFSAQSVSDLKGLSALERSPARPHIARIADSGLTDRFSIDRLRFYRGLRVMLLTCQCKRVELDGGDTAALIVCSDKGLSLTKDPIPAFASLLKSGSSTVFLISGGSDKETFGELDGVPEDIALPQDQKVLFGSLDLNGRFHDGGVLQIPAGPRIVVLSNDPLNDDVAPDTTAAALENLPVPQAGSLASDTDPAERLLDETGQDPDDDHSSVNDAAGDKDHHNDDGAGQSLEKPSVPAETDKEPELPAEASEPVAESDNDADEFADDRPDVQDNHVPGDVSHQAIEPAAAEFDETDVTSHEEVPAEAKGTPEDEAGDEEAPTTSEVSDEQVAVRDGFVFQPRRRPVRFAWKMDVDQCFTFLSDEFAEVLGPDATNIVGSSWEEVSEKFGLDPRGNIARALDRRDTWSGKTVAWPVSGAALRVPVDMAALPAFDRDRKFEGYRGFGVCRTSDALQDPDGFIPSPVPTPAFNEPVDDDAGNGDLQVHSQETDEASETAADDGDAARSDDENQAQMIDAPFADAEDELAGSEEAEDPDLDIRRADADTFADNDAESPTPDSEDDASDEIASVDASEPVPVEAIEDQPDAQSPEEKASEAAENEAEAETYVPVNETPESRDLKDLKPAQPNSLGGRTFLGASAAALVGSLAMFKGKKGSRPLETATDDAARSPEEKKAEDEHSGGEVAGSGTAEPETPDTLNLSEDLKNAAAALDAGPSENPSGETDGEQNADNPADISELEAETAPVDPEDVPDQLTAQAQPDEAVEADQAENDDDEPAATAGEINSDLPTSEETTADEQDYKHENGTYIAEVAVQDGAEEEAEKTAALPENTAAEEPVGIAGPAELKPSEIESAVKTLAKSYKPAEKRSPDLFDDGPDEHADTAPDAEEAMAETVADELNTGDQADDVSETEDLASDEPSESVSLDEETGDDASLNSEEEDPAAEEEREFFEETAAFEQEDRAAEADASPPAEPERKSGEVIPLATARPRVVPVDTSSLSRPERQAFRKIAEALGARLEGDLEEFEAPDPEEEALEDLPPDVPEAGPIDPSLLDRLPIGISIVHDREVLYANKALLKMLGYTSIAALSEAGGLEALFIDDTDELGDGIGIDDEIDEAMKMRVADGGVLTVDAHMHSVPWNGTRGLMISISERQQKPIPPTVAPASPNFFAGVRAELDSAHDQIAELDTILETATDGVLVLDRHGTIVKVNGSAEALFSANRADMIGAPFIEFLAPESHRAASDYLDGLSRNGVASILNDGREVLGQVPTGGLIPLFMTMGRITSSKDEAKFCAVLRDITQWKTAEEELTQAKRQAENASSQKSDFLAKISHEIRTPLNAIIGFSEVMMEERFGAIGNDRYKDYLKDIRTSGSHIMSLINDLLDLSKIEAGKLDLKFSAVSTNEVINECVALMQPQANRERVIIRASLPESVPDIVADPRSLRQIVLNLLSNGIKYNKSGGQVILSTALESNGEVALRVRDTGTGMTAKQLAAALEPFRQLHTASRGGGTGLGLPLTKALVEANRASFHIDSTPDQGTLVEIVFPTQRVLSE
ncbi:ATP-binding protein [Labrenzia sp. DG1229]|uniref:ATP-binding protein n=1 Tax=Labrenzia sp. DG1229 TaxID=681847 RepID=UPI0004918117|nr:ATP-binding protein [Labrenzia sp. DG1229]